MDAKKFFRGFDLGLQSGQDLIKKLGSFPPKTKFVFAGMGGSILAAELLKDVFANDFEIVEDYYLPVINNKNNTVVFCFSYSGNTEETLSVFREAKKLKLRTLSFSRGGKLEKLAKGKDFSAIPDFLAPRLAVPFMLGMLWGIFFKKGNQPTVDFSRLEKILKVMMPKMKDKIILIYSPRSLAGLAHFWEINIDETSKQPCFHGEIPDIDHHDLASFTGKKFNNRFFAIFLEDNNFLQKRIELTAKFFKKYLDIDYAIFRFSKKDRLKEFLFQMALVYSVSFALARFNRVNVFENSIQEKLKKELKK